MLMPKKLENNVKTVKKPIKTKMRAMKLGQFRRRMREIILPFEMNL
jgi:hypothetical protein